MPREMITIHVGQCGNQTGFEFWKQLCLEHGISADGTMNDYSKEVADRKDVFFYQADDSHFVPRAVILDTEPGVVEQFYLKGDYKNLFNPENIHVSADGSGAGNNFGLGYEYGASNTEELCDILVRESEDSESLEGFILTHSLSGGTGSGLGSCMIELLRDYFPKKVIQTYSVFPNIEGPSEVTVQPYNSVLSLNTLIDLVDCCYVFDNDSINKFIPAEFSVNNSFTSFADINKVIAMIMSMSTSPMRFNGSLNTSISNLISSTVPLALPRLHFLMSTYSPFHVGTSSSAIVKTSVTDIMNRLISNQFTAYTHPLADQSSSNMFSNYVNSLSILQGSYNSNEINEYLVNRSKIKFANSSNCGVQIIPAGRTSFVKHSHNVTGLHIANHLNIAKTFKKIGQQFDQLYNHKANLHVYQNLQLFKNDLSLFDESRAVLSDLIHDYNSISTRI